MVASSTSSNVVGSIGSSATLLEPLAFIERLAALIPRPRHPLLTYHGAQALAAKHPRSSRHCNSSMMGPCPKTKVPGDSDRESEQQPKPRRKLTKYYSWSELIILRDEKMQNHREPSREAHKRHRPDELVATAPNQVWSWDITYLASPVRGAFFYAYVILDVFSRKIVGRAVHDREGGELASQLIDEACLRKGVDRDRLVIHSDNGSPMKSATLLATLLVLGVATSFSRPSVSNDNPYSEHSSVRPSTARSTRRGPSPRWRLHASGSCGLSFGITPHIGTQASAS